MSKVASVAVYCGSNPGLRPIHAATAHALGQALARHGIELVWGGGKVGTMGVIADAVLGAGGRAYGVIPRKLEARELMHPRATEMVVVETMHERKAAMTARAGAFVALPGGLGTFDELFEALSWAQLGYHDKPVYLLDVDGYFASLIAQLDRCVEEGFVAPAHRALLKPCAHLGELMAALVPMPAGCERILHLATIDAMAVARVAGEYRGDSLEREGFIHCSTAEQIREVGGRLFAGRRDLLLLEIAVERVVPRIVRENLEGGAALYPHVYGPLNLDAIVAIQPWHG